MLLKKISGGASWLVVFLGNPGTKYDNTRHNVGFMTATLLEKQKKIKISRLRFNALSAICELSNEKVLLLKPQTYMNLSGNSVAPAAAFYKVPPENVIVVCDDVALPTGKLRIRGKGSSGGHNGLKSIISALGTDSFPRIKIGVGSPAPSENDDAMANWVLDRFSAADAKLIAESCKRVLEAISTIIDEGVEGAMNKYN